MTTGVLRRFLRLKPHALGAQGERLASRHLKRNRYRILGRNVRTKMGEIDIVALAPDKRTLVIVEVKTRRPPDVVTPRSPRPEDALTRDKRSRLIRLAQVEAKRRGMQRAPLRIDVIAIAAPDQGRPTIRHHKGAISA